MNDLSTQRITEEKRPFETEACSNCVCVAWNMANNKRGICTGFVKKPNPKVDILRLCFVDKQKVKHLSITLIEAMDITSLLSNLVAEYLDKQTKERIETESWFDSG